MTINERVRQIRKDKKMSMEAFGEEIGVTKSAIGNIENRRRNLSEQMIKSICREFNVSEMWLRHGEGNMYNQRSRREEIELYFDTQSPETKTFNSRLASIMSRLTVDEWDLLLKMGEKLRDEYASAQANAEIEEEVESYRQQLLAERGGGLSASFRNYGGGAGGSGDDSDKLA